MRIDGEAPYEVDFEALSDGQRSLIVLYTLLIEIATNAGALFLDEPENYVGLSELQPWLQLLDDAVGDRGQLFLISHHPEVIDFLAAENPIHFERPGGGPVRAKEAIFDHESGSRHRSRSPEVISMASDRSKLRGVVLAEDKRTERFFRHLLQESAGAAPGGKRLGEGQVTIPPFSARR